MLTRDDDNELLDKWAGRHFDYGMNLMQMRAGDHAQNLEQAIRHFQQSLQVFTRQTRPDLWASVQQNLGVIYRQRVVGNRADNQDKAIEHCNAALQVFTRQAFPTDWADVAFNLANLYLHKIRGPARGNLDEAIRRYKAVLEVYTRQANPLMWARAQCNLGVAWTNYQWQDHAEHIEQAIKHFTAALKVLNPRAHPREWSAAMHGLGKAWASRIKGVRDDNLMQAIQCYEAALTVRDDRASPDDWADTQHNLGVAYSQLYRGNRAENLERAIEILGQALRVQTPQNDPLKSAEITCKLADVYLQHSRRGRAEGVERAIELYQQALQVQHQWGTGNDWGPTCHNLAVAYGERPLGDRRENLSQAVRYGLESLHVFEPATSEWATVKTDLVDIFWKLANVERGQDLASAAMHLEDAITHGEQVLQALSQQPFGHLHALAHYNLGNAYGDRLGSDRAENQDAAICHYERALRFYTPQNYAARWADTHNNLGVTSMERVRGNRAQNLEQAIKHFKQALKIARADALPVLARRAARNLGQLYFEEGRWIEARDAFTRAITAGDDLLASAYSEAGRRTEVAEISRLYARAAYCQLQTCQPADALVQLEAGKTRLLNEALALAGADTTHLSAEQRNALLAKRQTVREIETEMRLPPPSTHHPGRDPAELLRQARADLNQLIVTIRKQHPGFMPVGLTLPEILALIPAGSALVAPFITSQGSAVFVVPHDTRTVTEEHVLRLDKFKDDNLNALLVGTENEPGWLHAYLSGNKPTWEAAIETMTQSLWQELMSLVHEHLQRLGVQRIILMPAGGLQLLPLHAAWRMENGARRYLMDDYDVIYAPSAFALKASQTRAASHTAQTALIAGVSEYKQLSPLHFTRTEVEKVGKLLQSQPLMDSEATPDAIREGAGGAAYLHLSCHGSFAWGGDPLASALYLADDRPLTLADILGKMDLNSARLVTLSACETGISDIRQSPDEYVGLPAGFLQAGAAGVVSSLWSVNDLSTALLMIRFYENHLKGKLPPAQALRQAQLWLRDVTNAELSDLLDQYCQNTQGTLSSLTCETLQAKSRDYAVANPKAQPFKHPYHWAPFAFYGV